MAKRPIILVVGSKCPPEAEKEFEQWYEKHVEDVLASKGARRAARLRLVASHKGTSPQYLAVYEFASREAVEAWDKSPEHLTALDELKERFVKRGVEVLWRAHYELMKTWQNEP